MIDRRTHDGSCGHTLQLLLYARSNSLCADLSHPPSQRYTDLFSTLQPDMLTCFTLLLHGIAGVLRTDCSGHTSSPPSSISSLGAGKHGYTDSFYVERCRKRRRCIKKVTASANRVQLNSRKNAPEKRLPHSRSPFCEFKLPASRQVVISSSML